MVPTDLNAVGHIHVLTRPTRHTSGAWQGKVVIPRVLPAVGGPLGGPGRPEGARKSTQGATRLRGKGVTPLVRG